MPSESLSTFEIIGFDILNDLVYYYPKYCHHVKCIELKYLLRGDGIYYCASCFEKRCVTSYEKMVEEIEKKDCLMLTSKEEFMNRNITKDKKISFIGKCTHEYEMVFNDLIISKGVCMNCNKLNIKNSNKDIYTNDKYYAQNIEIRGIEIVKTYISQEFDIIRLSNCLADIIIKPKDINEDVWLAIQLKATLKKGSNGCYKFDISQNDYTKMILLCTCIEETKFWILESHEIPNLKSINVCAKNDNLSSSKYDKFFIDKDDLSSKLKSLYELENSYKDSILVLEIPFGITHKLEFKYKKIREKAFKNILEFEYPDSETFVYDFMVNGLKVQEKVATQHIKNKNRYQADIRKRNGNGNTKIPYNEKDNDIYWINIPDTKIFYVIPTYELVKLGFISTDNIKGKTGIIFHPIFTVKEAKKNRIITAELNDYLFDYENIDVMKIKQIFSI